MMHENDDQGDMGHITIIFDSNRGTTIPRDFIEACPDWQGISDYERETLSKNGDDESYWDAWKKVLDNAFYVDEKGKRWMLYQDGSLFAISYDDNGLDDIGALMDF